MRLARTTLLFFALACASARPLPDREQLARVALPKLGNGTTALADLRGRVVLLDFWATWCEPCKEALPFYVELQRELAGRGFTVAAVSVDSGDDESVRRYFGAGGPQLLILRDRDGQLAERLGVQTMPTSFLLDRSGEAQFRLEGFSAGDRETIRSRILSLLEKR